MTTKIVFNWSLPSLNGSNGILRNHWARRKVAKNKLYYEIRSQTYNRHPGPVTIDVIRYYCGQALDPVDGLPSTMKDCLDMIVKAGVILDDNETIIVSHTIRQERVEKRKHVRTEITIADV